MEENERTEDTIVQQVRRARAAHADNFDNDLEAIVRDLKKHEKLEDRNVVTLAPKVHEDAGRAK